MKIITLWQPWATLIAIGLKKYETRSWGTSYRGPLLIHAAKRPPRRGEWTPLFDEIERITGQRPNCNDFEFGRIVAICDLRNCFRMVDTKIDDASIPMTGRTYIETKRELERRLGDWQSGRFAWQLDNVRRLSIPWKGAQGLKDFTAMSEIERFL
jgi:hypothetical protein